MRVLHKLGNVRASRDVAGDIAFLLGNKNGGYTYFSTGKKTRYEGVFFSLNHRVYRVVAELGLGKEPEKIVNLLHSVEKHSSQNKERFFMPYTLNSIAYELEKTDWINVSLDVRESYDTSSSGSYAVLKDGGTIIVAYNKGKDKCFVSLKAEKPEFEMIGEFGSVHNERDRERNSPPYVMPVYKALRVKSKKLVISFSDDRETAINESKNVYSSLEELKEKRRRQIDKLLSKEAVGSDEKWLAYNCCINSLNQLTTSDGIIAGFPWFFQYWTRDELISLRNARDKMKKTILLKDLHHILDDGRIPNKIPAPDVGSADAVGWLFKRIDESLEIFKNKERMFIRDKLIKSIVRLNETHVRDILVYNSAKETWMDSSYNDDGREGARVEIQALMLHMYRMAYRLTQNEKFLKLEGLLRGKVRDGFWDGDHLFDGLGDPTIRPNAFIAAYICPSLLTAEEWTKCFERILPRLWCDWGGLSSIDREHPLHHKYSTGEDPRSYHRGDSWYYLNNMAALVLHRLDPKRFEGYVDDLVEASTEDILWQGMIGHHSEISSAAEQRAEGCGAQAWSAAMYIEMIDELSPD